MRSHPPRSPAEHPSAGPGPVGAGGSRPRNRAPELTHREALWYARQVEKGGPLVLRLRDGEELSGVLEWYDRSAFRLRLPDGGHLVVQKSAVQSFRKG